MAFLYIRQRQKAIVGHWRYLMYVTVFITFYYAPPTIVEGHYVFWSVHPYVRSSVRPSDCPSVRLSVRLSRFRLKFLVQVVLLWSWRPINLKLSTHMIWSFSFLSQIRLLTPISRSTKHRKWKCEFQVKVFGQGSFWWSWSPINLKLHK